MMDEIRMMKDEGRKRVVPLREAVALARHSGEGRNPTTSSFRTPRSGDPEPSVFAPARHSGEGRNPVSKAASHGWIRIPMAEVGHWCGGGTPSKSNPRFWTNGNIPWVSPKDMKSDVITDTQDHITEEAVKRSATHLVEAGSVLLVARSGILQHTLPVAIASRQVALNQDIKAVKPRKDIRADYLALALKAFEREILHRCTKTGTTVQSLELPVFMRFEIPVAPFEDQRQIVAEIEKQFTRLDDGVTALRRVQANLKRYRAAVLKAACEGRLVPAESNLWREMSLSELLRSEDIFNDGDWVESKDQDPDGEVRLIQLADVGDGTFRNRSNRFLTKAKAIELGCTFLKRGDILIARMPDPLGRACIFPGVEQESVTVVDVCIVRSFERHYDSRWLMHTINSSSVRAQISALQAGSTRKRISRKNLSTIRLRVPPLAEQARIVAEVERRLSVIEELEAAVTANVQRAIRLRQSTLQRAFAWPDTASREDCGNVES